MEESFSVRVGKTFDILAAGASSPARLSSLWSLTGEEIEKREWNRDKGSPEPQLKDDDDDFELEKDLLDLDDDDVEEEDEKPKPDDYNEEQWEIKNCIGLDSTLDHEVTLSLTL